MALVSAFHPPDGERSLRKTTPYLAVFARPTCFRMVTTYLHDPRGRLRLDGVLYISGCWAPPGGREKKPFCTRFLNKLLGEDLGGCVILAGRGWLRQVVARTGITLSLLTREVRTSCSQGSAGKFPG